MEENKIDKNESVYDAPYMREFFNKVFKSFEKVKELEERITELEKRG